MYMAVHFRISLQYYQVHCEKIKMCLKQIENKIKLQQDKLSGCHYFWDTLYIKVFDNSSHLSSANGDILSLLNPILPATVPASIVVEGKSADCYYIYIDVKVPGFLHLFLLILQYIWPLFVITKYKAVQKYSVLKGCNVALVYYSSCG